MLTCTVCGLWYPTLGSDRLGICADCYTQNFAGAQPPFDVRHAPDTSEQALTPRQLQALRRVAERWAQEDE